MSPLATRGCLGNRKGLGLGLGAFRVTTAGNMVEILEQIREESVATLARAMPGNCIGNVNSFHLASHRGGNKFRFLGGARHHGQSFKVQLRPLTKFSQALPVELSEKANNRHGTYCERGKKAINTYKNFALCKAQRGGRRSESQKWLWRPAIYIYILL